MITQQNDELLLQAPITGVRAGERFHGPSLRPQQVEHFAVPLPLGGTIASVECAAGIAKVDLVLLAGLQAVETGEILLFNDLPGSLLCRRGPRP